MFIYSVRASTLKFFAVLCVACIALVAVIFYIPTESVEAMAEKEETFNFEKIKTNDDRIQFLSQFGWEVEKEAVNEAEVKIPGELDGILSAYNDIHSTLGLDIGKYKGKNVTRYTYKVTNYPDYEGTVYANIIVYKNKVIAGDISSSDIEGFIHGLSSTQSEDPK